MGHQYWNGREILLQQIMQQQNQKPSLIQQGKPRVLFKVTLDQINLNLSYTHNPDTRKLEHKSSYMVSENQELLDPGQCQQSNLNLTDKLPKERTDRSSGQFECMPKLREVDWQAESKQQVQANNSANMDNYLSVGFYNESQVLNVSHPNKIVIEQNAKALQQQQFQYVSLIPEEQDGDPHQQGNQCELPTKKMNRKQASNQCQPIKKTPLKMRKNLITIIKQETPPLEQKEKAKRNRRPSESQKKLNMKLLQEIKDSQVIVGRRDDDEESSGKPNSESEQLRQRASRNRRIVVYIKRALQATKAIGGITLKQLFISVFKNYERELSLIKNEKNRDNRFESLRRRIQEYLKVLAAVDIIGKSHDFENGSQMVRLQRNDAASANYKQKKLELQKVIKQKQQRIRYLKQTYFDSLTRKQVLDSLSARNKRLPSSPDHRVSLVRPVRCFMVGGDSGFQLIARKSNQDCLRADCVTIKSTYVEQIHTIDYFTALRRVITPLISIYDYSWFRRDLRDEYLKCIENEDRWERNRIVRLALIEKMKQRNSGQSSYRKRRNQEVNALMRYKKSSVRDSQMVEAQA